MSDWLAFWGMTVWDLMVLMAAVDVAAGVIVGLNMMCWRVRVIDDERHAALAAVLDLDVSRETSAPEILVDVPALVPVGSMS